MHTLKKCTNQGNRLKFRCLYRFDARKGGIGPDASRQGIQSLSLCLIHQAAGSVVMTRTAARREWLPVGVVCLIPGDRENGTGKRWWSSYQDPTPVPLGEKPKACRGTVGEGTRQIGRRGSLLLSSWCFYAKAQSLYGDYYTSLQFACSDTCGWFS